MSESPAPPWRDDLFPFPAPAAFRTLIDIAWQHGYASYLEEGTYDHTQVTCHYDFMFDLERVPRPLDGWCESAEFFQSRSHPMFAPPEFVPFGSLGDGGCVGWIVPAPELEHLDHRVALASGHDHGVTMIGADTRAGLEFMLSWTLRRWRERPELTPPAWRDPEVWLTQNQYLIEARIEDHRLLDRLATELDLHPDPDKAYAGSSWDGTVVKQDVEFEIAFDVPEGWRHARGADGIGVLAPFDAFADCDPVVADLNLSNELLEAVLSGAADALDAGHPATALLGLKDTFVNSPTCYFADLKPLWSRAYRDLGRIQFVERLDLMASMYRDLPCYCGNLHRQE